MHLVYDDHHEEFRDSLRALLARRCTNAVVRGAVDSGTHDLALWHELCQGMSLPGLPVPAEWGGEGFSLVETCLALQEVGRCLAPVPFLTTALTVEAISSAGSAADCARLLPPLLRGEQVATLALSGTDGFSGPAAGVQVRHTGAGPVVQGRVDYVMYGGAADLVVVPACSADGEIRLCAVPTSTSVSVHEQSSTDLLRPLARLEFSSAPGVLLGGADLDRLMDVLRILIAADLVGAAEHCLESTVEYATTRTQFNRPIGSFQAVKHRCAELAVELDAARAILMFATVCAVEGRPELGVVASACKAQASETLDQCATSAVQLLGGIGFTWEHNAHLYLRRARSTQALWGTSRQDRMHSAARARVFDRPTRPEVVR